MYSISTLLTRNLNDVFGENDPARLRAGIDEIFNEECVFYYPKGGAYWGHDEIDRIAGVIKATHPDFQYRPIAEPKKSANGRRVQWVSGRPGGRRLMPVLISSSRATVLRAVLSCSWREALGRIRTGDRSVQGCR
jgi:hypothetical protein